MTEDLTSALRGFTEQEERAVAAATADPGAVAHGLARRVGRRRAVRAGAAVAAVAVIAAGVVGGVRVLDRPEPAPPAVPAPSPSPDLPTTAPAPVDTPAADPVTAAPPVSVALADAQPMPDGALAASDATWVLVQHASQTEDGAVVRPRAVFLVSPQGPVYAVPTAVDLTSWTVVDWLPGTSLALVTAERSADTRVVDLLTGSGATVGATRGYDARFAGDGTTDVLLPVGDQEKVLRRVAADGTVLAEGTSRFWAEPGAGHWLPDGRGDRLLVLDPTGARVVDAATLADRGPLAVPYPGSPGACVARSWAGADVLVVCSPQGSGPLLVDPANELWLVPAGGGAARRVPPGPEATGVLGAWEVGDRVVVGVAELDGTSSWWQLTGDGVVPLAAGAPGPLVAVEGVRGRELLAVLLSGPAGAQATAVVALDPVTGASRTVLSAEAAALPTTSVLPNGVTAGPGAAGE
jgi:hypothetical protein